MGNLFAELKRRHIYRVAAAYAVVAWVLLQLVNNLIPALNLPNSAAALVLVLLGVGFPIALVFAWIRELPPADGTAARATTGKLDWALMAALVVVIGLVSYQQLAPTTGAKTAQQALVPTASAQAGGISVAVLPFVNLSDDRQQEFFSDGMTEEITAALAKIPGLRVTGRTSAFEFKGQNKDLRTIGQALGVSHLIEGSVRKAGNRVRVTAQLVRAADDSHLWAENYDRDLADVFAIQEDIAQTIATSLRVPLGLQQGEALVSNRTKDLESYQQYLRARSLVRARTIDEAISILEPVVARDPGFAPTWAVLAQAYFLRPVYQDHP
jgi:adenylate cyclase